jgi:ribonuclease Z
LIFHPFGSGRKQLIYEDEKLEIHTIPLKHRIPCCGFLFREKPPLLNLRKEVVARHNIPVTELLNLKKGKDYTDDKGTIIPNSTFTFPPFKTRSLAFCSDTKYTESILPQISGVDILYHEATFSDDLRETAEATGHSTARQAAIIAGKANAGKLIIGHFSARYKTIESLLKEARDEFPETYPAEDGECHMIERQRLPDNP